MQYLPNNIVALTYNEFVPKVMKVDNYDRSKQRGNIIVHGIGGNGRQILIEYDSLAPKYQEAVKAIYGEPKAYIAKQPLKQMVQVDIKAKQFFADYTLSNGQPLPIDYQLKYSRQCDWLNAITTCLADKRTLKDTLKISLDQFWDNIVTLAKNDTVKHDLPTSVDRMRRKHNKYKVDGYKGIIEAWRFGNDHARIVNKKIEGLLLALYAKRHGRATLKDVCDDYNAFISGKELVVDLKTGEQFEVKDFMVKGSLYELDQSTVTYYLNLKHNRSVIDAIKLSGHDFQQKWMPHNHRKQAEFAFSAVSMDDYLPPFKTLDGKRTVWMYVIFDMASKAIVGVSYGIKKDARLVDEALRDMIRLITRMGWGMPMEIQLERSLNWQRRGSEEAPDLFTAGNVFPFIRFAKGDNSQEKLAESLLGDFKYDNLADEEGFLGRPFGNDENFKLNRDKKEARYMMDRLVAMLKHNVAAYNNSQHPVKKNLTKWEYLCQHQQPQTINYPVQVIMPYIGIKTETSIRRCDLQVNNEFYDIGYDYDAMQAGGIADVDAYWIPGANGESADTVYVYQNNRYIGPAHKIEKYQVAQAERTDRDYEIMGKQTGRQRGFERKVAEGLVNMQEVGSIATTEVDSNGIIRVGVSYDKLAEEEEDMEMALGTNDSDNEPVITPKKSAKSTKKALLAGGYYPKNGNRTDNTYTDNDAESRAMSDL